MKLVVPNLVEDRKSQLNSVQLARGFAALAVVAFHAETIQEKYFQVKVLPQFFDGGISGVDLFFCTMGGVPIEFMGAYAPESNSDTSEATNS